MAAIDGPAGPVVAGDHLRRDSSPLYSIIDAPGMFPESRELVYVSILPHYERIRYIIVVFKSKQLTALTLIYVKSGEKTILNSYSICSEIL